MAVFLARFNKKVLPKNAFGLKDVTHRRTTIFATSCTCLKRGFSVVQLNANVSSENGINTDQLPSGEASLSIYVLFIRINCESFEIQSNLVNSKSFGQDVFKFELSVVLIKGDTYIPIDFSISDQNICSGCKKRNTQDIF